MQEFTINNGIYFFNDNGVNHPIIKGRFNLPYYEINGNKFYLNPAQRINLTNFINHLN